MDRPRRPRPPRTGRAFNGNGDDGDPSVALALEVSLDAPDALLVEAAGLFSPRRTPAVSAWPRLPDRPFQGLDVLGRLERERGRIEAAAEPAGRQFESLDLGSDLLASTR
ncbi:MAG: hypothetical protein ACRDNE_01060 [Gaiellaceae bacterium]